MTTIRNLADMVPGRASSTQPRNRTYTLRIGSTAYAACRLDRPTQTIDHITRHQNQEH